MNDLSSDAWDISEGITDPERFFTLLPSLFPEATHLFVEGASMTGDVQRCYARFVEEGPFLPGRQTLMPRSTIYRCAAVPELFQSLSRLAREHAAPELLDHLSLYRDERPLLEWHDAFANEILLDGKLSEDTVARLAIPFGCKYGRARHRRVSLWTVLVVFGALLAVLGLFTIRWATPSPHGFIEVFVGMPLTIVGVVVMGVGLARLGYRRLRG